MLPSPPSSSNDILLVPHTMASPSYPTAKGHLGPQFNNLPRRRRPTQLPTPSSESSDNIPGDSSSNESDSDSSSSSSSHSSNSIPRKNKVTLAPGMRLPSIALSDSSSSDSPFPQPHLHYPPARRYPAAKGHLQPSAHNIPRRPRPVQVLPGSGIYALPPADDSDDSGIPEPNFRFTGRSAASTLARALFQLCASESVGWYDGMVEGVYMRLHDLGQVPLPWMGALRREGLQMVEKEVRVMLLGSEEAPHCESQ